MAERRALTAALILLLVFLEALAAPPFRLIFAHRARTPARILAIAARLIFLRPPLRTEAAAGIPTRRLSSSCSESILSLMAAA